MQAICGPLKDLVEFKGCNEWEKLISSLYYTYYGLYKGIAAFENSLYEQKHAFYFRRVREWHEYYEVWK